MPVVYSNTSDGNQGSGLNPNWNTVHDSVGFGNPNTTATRTSTDGVRYEYVTGRGSAQYYLHRSFFDFDTSGITSTVASATFRVKTHTNNAATPIVVCKSGHDPSTVTDDWFSTWLTGQSITLSGWSSGDVTAYSSATAVASHNNFTDITLNASALSDLVSLSSFKIAVLHENDLADTAPTSGVLRTGFYYANSSGTSSDPHLDYTLSTGYGNAVSGVAAANIGSINGVATANISKVNGV